MAGKVATTSLRQKEHGLDHTRRLGSHQEQTGVALVVRAVQLQRVPVRLYHSRCT
jgi:hypothetical protein